MRDLFSSILCHYPCTRIQRSALSQTVSERAVLSFTTQRAMGEAHRARNADRRPIPGPDIVESHDHREVRHLGLYPIVT